MLAEFCRLNLRSNILATRHVLKHTQITGHYILPCSTLIICASEYIIIIIISPSSSSSSSCLRTFFFSRSVIYHILSVIYPVRINNCISGMTLGTVEWGCDYGVFICPSK